MLTCSGIIFCMIFRERQTDKSEGKNTLCSQRKIYTGNLRHCRICKEWLSPLPLQRNNLGKVDETGTGSIWYVEGELSGKDVEILWEKYYLKIEYVVRD